MFDSKALKRLKLIQGHLTSNKFDNLNYKSKKNQYNKWRKNVNFDKAVLEDIYFPVSREIRDLVYKIMASNPEFK